MRLPDDWICPSSERCLCGSICEAREAMDEDDGPDWELWTVRREQQDGGEPRD